MFTPHNRSPRKVALALVAFRTADNTEASFDWKKIGFHMHCFGPVSLAGRRRSWRLPVGSRVTFEIRMGFLSTELDSCNSAYIGAQDNCTVMGKGS